MICSFSMRLGWVIDDCYVPCENVTIYDQLPIMGGSMDGAKVGEGKYTCRGERELEPYMECFWYLGSKIPSLYTPGRTITEETVDVNKADRVYAHSRILHQQGKAWDGIHDFRMSEKLAARDARFGHPEKFCSNVEKSRWMSAMVTIKGYKQFCAKFREKYGYPKDCVTGAISIMDSAWDISFVLYDKYYPNQADDEDILITQQQPAGFPRRAAAVCIIKSIG